MPINLDYKEMFKILLEEKVEYLLVGAHAVTYHSELRYTKDVNASRFISASTRFAHALLVRSI